MNPEIPRFKKDRQWEGTKKRTDNPNGKGPTIEIRKGPTNYLPVTVKGVVGEDDLRRLLLRSNQGKWNSPKKVAGLLILMDFIIRKGGKTFKISSELSHDYVRRIKGHPGTVEQPLALLVHLGILEVVTKARVGPHMKVAAEYRLPPCFSKRFDMTILIYPQQMAKMRDAENRNKKRLNRKHPFRARLIEDMERVSLSVQGESVSLKMMMENQKDECIRQLIDTLNGKRDKRVKVNPFGTINTFINSIPRELKPHLEIDGKPVAKCDIEGAHFCILQRIVRDRVAFVEKQERAAHKVRPLEIELEKLSAMIEAGDIYTQGIPNATKAERKDRKLAMLSVLNTMTAKAVHISEYAWLRETFPLTFRVVEDIKKGSHKNLSIQLSNYTSRIINGALMELQERGIPALPDTDALIVPKEHAPLARETVEGFLRAIAGAGKVSVS